MIRHYISREFAAFLITGGLAAVVNFGSRLFLNLFVSYQVAIVLAYFAGMITAFVLARMFVFTESQQKLHHSVTYFVLVNLVAITQTWLVSVGLAFYVLPCFGIIDNVHEIAHAVGIAFPVFTSYLGHKKLSFA